MKKVILSFILGLLCFTSVCAMNRNYYLELGGISLRLILFENRNYYLVDERDESDHVTNINMLSFGIYEVQNDKLILLDELIEYKITFRIKHYTLATEHGFHMLKNRSFILDQCEFLIEEDFYKKYAVSYRQEFNPSISSSNKSHEIVYCKYDDMNQYCSGESRCYLKLDENGYFGYYYCGLLLSRGGWRLLDNGILELIDEDLDFKYILEAIDDNNIRSLKMVTILSNKENLTCIR